MVVANIFEKILPQIWPVSHLFVTIAFKIVSAPELSEFESSKLVESDSSDDAGTIC
jgi:hypothetical protein